MNIIKKLSAFALAAVLLSTSVLLWGCGSSEAEYKVSIVDALGTPYNSGIVVKFMQNGEQIALQACDENGVAVKTLPKGNYETELSFTADAENYYYEKGASLTAKETEATIILANMITTDPTVYTVGAQDFDVYDVLTGCTYVNVTSENRSYFKFTPTEAGLFEFSIPNGENVQIGYYGAPHFIQSESSIEVTDNKFTISVKADMIGSGEGGTSAYVIGIDSLDADTKNCVLGIQRLGDPIKTVEDEPWIIYEATHEMTPYTLPDGAEIKEFDLTASTDTYNIVYNEEDGFYHLDSADGPLVLVKLSEDCTYIACFETMLDRSGVVKYFFDGEATYENFIKKESYSECLLEYIPCADEAMGVYPLTEDLKYIIQQRGEYTGWWDIESNGYIFMDMDGNRDSTINPDLGWLLMCCYID